MNIPDRNYTFTYYVYYESPDTGVKYDVPVVDYMTDVKYTAKSYDKSSAITSSSLVFLEGSNGYDAYVHAELNYDIVAFNKPVTITYGGVDYAVELKEKDNLMEATDNSYTYTVDKSNYSYAVKVSGSGGIYNKIYIELKKNVGEDYKTAPTTAEISYTGGPYALVSTFTDVDFSGVIGTENKTIGEFESTIDFTNATYSLEDSYNGAKTLTIDGINYKNVSDNDKFYIGVYYNGKEVSRSYQIYYTQASVDIDPVYRNVELRLIKAKYYGEIEFLMAAGEEHLTPYFDTQVIKEKYSIESANAITELNMSFSYEDSENGTYTITATGDGFSDNDYYLAVEESNLETDGTVGDTTFSSNLTNLTTLDKLIVRVKKAAYGEPDDDDALLEEFELPVTATIGELSDGKVSYSIDLDDSYTISNSSVTVNGIDLNNITSKSGNINVTQELHETVEFVFDLELTNENGIVISYSFTVSKGF